jgi:polysaccharide pyruvyl transferase WcaK-like protein
VRRPIRSVALCGYLGSGNIGNDASLETVLAWLTAAYPEVEVRCITIAPGEVSARYRVPSVPLAWHSPREGSNRIAEALGKLLGRLIDLPRSFLLAGSVDAVIVPGMGVLEESLRVRPWGLPLGLFLLAAACRLRRRPFVLLDVGAEWAVNWVTRRLYVATVGLAAHVSYRDHSSAAAMSRAGAREPEAIVPDLAFAHPAAALATPEVGRLVVGVMAYYGQGDDPVRGVDVRRKYVATLTQGIARLADAGDRVVLVGGDRVDLDVARDVRSAVLAECQGLTEDAIVVRDCATFSELSEEMAQAEVVIASRFHNLICALRLARPTISVGYAGKNRNLMDALGLDEYCQEIGQLDPGRLVTQIRTAQMDAKRIAGRIRTGTADYAEDVARLLDRVSSEVLGLPPRQWRAFELNDEIDAWYGT